MNVEVINNVRFFDKNITTKTKKSSFNLQNSTNAISASFGVENLKANFAPLSFKGNAPSITKAYIITGEKDDLPLLATKENNSYLIDFDSQTEVIYGVDAIKYLNDKTEFKYDTQVIFPKKSEGVLIRDGVKIPLSENSAVLINENTNAEVRITKGYPMLVISKKDYDWYERYGKDAKDVNIRNKFNELIYYNSHLYNGEFSPNSLLPDKFREEGFLKSIGIDKWASRNYLVNDIYAKKDLLNEQDRKQIEFVKSIIDKLFEKKLIKQKEDGYLRFERYYSKEYLAKLLTDYGFNEDEIKLCLPILTQARQARMESRCATRNSAEGYSSELIQKLKDCKILHNNKLDADKNIYWFEYFGNEQSLRQKLQECGFNWDEQNIVVANWNKANITGFDLSGLKFLDDDIAIYNLDDKLNNWTHEKTNWVTNSTAIASKDGKAPFVGVSMVQNDEKRPIVMSEIRKEEQLHSHPNLDEKRQTEVYLITSGAAALNVVKNGKTEVKILKEGELAVVGPGVAHCVNSILGEYEHVVVQLPSAFQYGFGFKAIVDPPVDYDSKALEKEAFEKFACL